MADKKTSAKPKEEPVHHKPEGFVFSKRNYQLLIAGLFLLLIGFILMTGGGSKDPNVFDPGIFSFRRVTFGPLVVLAGFILEGVAIMYRPKSGKKE
jgi:hypothetical protein